MGTSEKTGGRVHFQRQCSLTMCWGYTFQGCLALLRREVSKMESTVCSKNRMFSQYNHSQSLLFKPTSQNDTALLSSSDTVAKLGSCQRLEGVQNWIIYYVPHYSKCLSSPALGCLWPKITCTIQDRAESRKKINHLRKDFFSNTASQWQ